MDDMMIGTALPLVSMFGAYSRDICLTKMVITN
ncbi:uncharacterized protein METZ01_LOCUS123796 [marine metagenome]|uniref:Uncharacterized protein n=1 Tax=marine metagenome TaxID=408172 RepID=A0A381Y2L2_9ZZZZ